MERHPQQQKTQKKLDPCKTWENPEKRKGRHLPLVETARGTKGWWVGRWFVSLQDNMAPLNWSLPRWGCHEWRHLMGVSENSGTPKSSILIGFSITNHPFWGTPIFGNTLIVLWFLRFLMGNLEFFCEHLNMMNKAQQREARKYQT